MKRLFTYLWVFLALTALGADQKPEILHLLSFHNGDKLKGQVLGLEGATISFVPLVSPNQTLKFKVSKIDRISCYTCNQAERRRTDGPYTMQLHDGSVLKGDFKRLTATHVEFQLSGVSLLKIPRTSVDFILQKTQADRKKRSEKTHVLVMKSGDILTGALSPAGPRLRIKSKVIDASFNIKDIAGLYFPSRAAPSPIPLKTVRSTITMPNGTSLYGYNPKIRSGKISFKTTGGQQLAINTGNVSIMTFFGDGTQASLRNVLVWGRYADRHQEYSRTLFALKKGLPRGWKVTKDFSFTFDKEFKQKLMKSRTLLIPEMERWKKQSFRGRKSRDPAKLAAQLRTLSADFLRHGGNIVILCPSRYQTNFLKDAGLLDVSATKSGAGVKVRFTKAGVKVAKGIGTGFKSPNATQFYSIGSSIKSQVWAKSVKGVMVTGRRVGNGWVILMGMDFYGKNKASVKLLSNGVMYK